MNPHKPGWQTSEFWLSIAAQLIALLVLTGVIAASDKDTVQGSISELIKSAFALIVSATNVWKYIQSRIEAKKAAAELQIESIRANTANVSIR